MNLGNLGKMVTPTKLGRNARTAVADHGEVAIKSVTSWEILYNQLLKVGKSELGSWMGKFVYWCK